METNNNTKAHKCSVFNGIMIDVTLRQNGDIHCRRCGNQLTREQVEPNTLNLIDLKLQKRNQR